MNIYIQTEISSREEDSNLLKAIIAAKKGGKVIISNFETIKFLLEKNLLKEGIFHTKSLVHNQRKDKLLKLLSKKGFMITSLDEENGIIKDKKSFKNFIETRFTEESLKNADKIFCWGREEYETLINHFPTFKDKFLLTGSSRLDMWKKNFQSYWHNDFKHKEKQVLISLNFPLVNGFKTYEKILEELNKSGYFSRSNKYLNEIKEIYEITKKNFELFKEMIVFLAQNLKKVNFVVRPHPVEKKQIWVDLLKNFKNVTIDNNENFNTSLYSANILIHNSCTTAFQAALVEKKIFCYSPLKENIEHGRLANSLGEKIVSKENLLQQIREYYIKSTPEKVSKENFELINSRLHNSFNNSLSSDLIVNTWAKLFLNLKYKRNNLFMIKFSLALQSLYKNFLSFFNVNKNNFDTKFHKYDFEAITAKIDKLKKVLKINENFKVQILSNQCIFIKKDEF